MDVRKPNRASANQIMDVHKKKQKQKWVSIKKRKEKKPQNQAMDVHKKVGKVGAIKKVEIYYE